MNPFPGFSRDTQYTPVPNLMFGVLLEEVDNLGELRCILRFMWLAHQKKGFPRTVAEEELVVDRVLLHVLGNIVDIRRSIERAVERGVLLRAADSLGNVVLALNTDANREVMTSSAPLSLSHQVEDVTAASPVRRNVFAMYEQNIGMLTPIMAERLKDAEQTYPLEWIEDAFREAVENNKRSWRYMESILNRWAIEGRDYGKSGRHLKTIDVKQYLRRYGGRR